MKYLIFHFALVSRQTAALSSATKHAMPQECGGKWATECLNSITKYPLLIFYMRDTNTENIIKSEYAIYRYTIYIHGTQ